MENLMDFDTATLERMTSSVGPVQPGRSGRATDRAGERTELMSSEPIDIFHWAAVALVTALMCAVLGYAAGTPALSRAAHITSLVFGAMGGALVLSGVVRGLRARIATQGAIERLAVAESS
jgi:hypothetical protein